MFGIYKDQQENTNRVDGEERFGKGVMALFTIDDYKKVAENTVVKNVVEEIKNMKVKQENSKEQEEERQE